MNPLIGIAAAIFPEILKVVAGDKAGTIAEKVAKSVTEATGANTPEAAKTRIDGDPKVAADLQVRLAQIALDAQAADLAAAEKARQDALERDRIALDNTSRARAALLDLINLGGPIPWTPSIISYIVVLGFLILVFLLMFGKYTLPETSDTFVQIINICIGAIVAGFATVINFWLGSSLGSRDKDRALAVSRFQLPEEEPPADDQKQALQFPPPRAIPPSSEQKPAPMDIPSTTSARMMVGADVNAVVTANMIQMAEAETKQSIRFWGRYFKGPGNTSPEQYQPAAEAAVFNQRQIRVLPIGRQTNHVGGNEALGAADGANNANAIIAGFGVRTLSALPGGLLIFLDVEGPPHASMSADYYRGWSNALSQTAAVHGVKLLPGVYGAEGDSLTWAHLVQAIEVGATCTGTWIARPGTLGCHPLRFFNEDNVRPPGLPTSIKVLIWQCVQECHNLDFNILNPEFEADTLGKMVIPDVSQKTVA
jgi:hypothetical protein